MAAQPSPAMPSTSNDPPEPVPRSQQPANSQEATATPTHDSTQAIGAQLAEKLRGFVLRQGCLDDQNKWARITVTQGNTDAVIVMGSCYLQSYLTVEKNSPVRDAMRNIALTLLENAADHGSATILGLGFIRVY